jgi:3-hydroxyacyl-CoA dehydrogenase
MAERIGVVGAGTIALGLLRTVAQSGPAVAVVRSEASRQRLTARLTDCPHAVVVTRERDALAECTFVIEAVSETRDAKRDVLADLDGHVADGGLLASTTSSLDLRDLAEVCDRHTLIGFHPFTPVQRMRVIELAFVPGTAEAIRLRAFRLCEELEKEPIEVPPLPGYVVNRVLFPYLFAAVELMTSQRISPQSIDRCMTGGVAHPVGPFAVLDMIGLDIAVEIGRSLQLEVPRVISDMVARGECGYKTGQGFYSYESRVSTPPPPAG